MGNKSYGGSVDFLNTIDETVSDKVENAEKLNFPLFPLSLIIRFPIPIVVSY